MSAVASSPARRSRPLACAFVALLALAGCDAVRPGRDRAAEQALYDFSSAMRWSDFDAAYDFVDPKTKIEHPLSSLDHERFKQIEVSAYEVEAKTEGEGTMDLKIRLELINRNTQVPRSISYREHWRWDAESKHWWLTSGLPDVSPQD